MEKTIFKIFHNGQINEIEKSIFELDLGGKRVKTEKIEEIEFKKDSSQKKLLWTAFVYGISLLAVGSSVIKKAKIAKIAGYFQILLAVIGFVEVLRRFFGEKEVPDFNMMITISVLALVANGVCLYLFQKSKGKEESHMKASMIFTSNDIIINLGVITAGLLVGWLDSSKPDLIIGTIVFILVIQGAYRILKLGVKNKTEDCRHQDC